MEALGFVNLEYEVARGAATFKEGLWRKGRSQKLPIYGAARGLGIGKGSLRRRFRIWGGVAGKKE